MTVVRTSPERAAALRDCPAPARDERVAGLDAVASFIAAMEASARALEPETRMIRDMLVAIERMAARTAAKLDVASLADTISCEAGLCGAGAGGADVVRHVVVTLSPGVLGGSVVHIDLSGGELAVAIDPATPAAATLAAANAPALRRALESRASGAYRRVSVSVKKGSRQ